MLPLILPPFPPNWLLIALTQFIIDYYECALQCEVSKDNKTIQKIVDAVIKIADTVENIVVWIFGETEEPDLEQYFDEIEGDTNE